VAYGVSLTIEAGVVVVFVGSAASLTINGMFTINDIFTINGMMMKMINIQIYLTNVWSRYMCTSVILDSPGLFS